MPRLFIALPFNTDNNNEKINELYNYLNKYDSDLKIVPPNNYHITLKFFGECSEKALKKIEEGIENSVENNKKIIPFSLFGLGVFPDLKKANVLWAGIRTDEKSINDLAQSVDNFASGLGYKKEKRSFIPHLTLARVRKGKKLNENIRQFLVENKELFLSESTFDRLVLYSSTLTSNGPIYTEVKSIQFSKNGEQS